MRKRQKVFCIGNNKTGSTSMERVLKDLGYRMPKQDKQESQLVEEIHKGNYAPLKALCKRYDAFQDLPFSQSSIYAVADALFPGSKFILTVRDSEKWFQSLVRFQLKTILKKAGVEKIEDFGEETFKDKAIYLHKNYMYNVVKRHAAYVDDNEVKHDWSLVYDRDHRIQVYEERNAEIVKYFQSRPDQLLVIDVTREKDNSRIIDFLGLPEKFIGPIPHLNKSK